MTMTIELVPIDSLHVWPGNSRVGDVDRIATSLQRFGQTRPILVQAGTDRIVAGNHTYKAAQQIGMERIAIVRSEMTDDEAEAYVIADNRLSDLASWDDDALAATLQQLMDKGLLEGTGYTPDEVDDLLVLLGGLPDAEAGEFTGGHAPTWAAPEDTRGGELGREGPPLRQIVLLYDAEESERAGKAVKTLQAAWDLTTVAGVVLKALEQAAASCA